MKKGDKDVKCPHPHPLTFFYAVSSLPKGRLSAALQLFDELVGICSRQVSEVNSTDLLDKIVQLHSSFLCQFLYQILLSRGGWLAPPAIEFFQ